MEAEINPENGSIKVSFTLTEPSDIARAIELLAKMAVNPLVFSEISPLSKPTITHEQMGDYLCGSRTGL